MTYPYRHDRLLILGVLLLLSAEVFWFCVQLRLVSWSFTAPVQEKIGIARVQEKYRQVSKREAQQLSWYPVARDEVLGEHDSILTGPESYTRLHFADGSELWIGPSSLVRLKKPQVKDALLVVELSRGQINVKNQNKPIFLKTQDKELVLSALSSASVRSDSFTKEAEVRVETGKVELEGENLEAASGEVLSWELAKAPEKTLPNLNFVDLTPKLHATFIQENNPHEIKFSWEGAEAEYLDIDFDPEFSSPKSFKVKGREYVVPLESGKYYWRLRKSGQWGSVQDFILLPKIDYKPQASVLKKIFKPDQNIILAWKRIESAENYTIEVSETSGFQKVLKRKNTDSLEADLGKLKAGKYYWRVVAEHPSLGRWPASQAYPFTVKRVMTAPKVKGVKILEDPKEPEKKENPDEGKAPSLWDRVENFIFGEMAHAEDAEARIRLAFEWEAMPKAQKYQFEVSRDAKFEVFQVQIEVDTNHVALELPQSDIYYWRVAAIDKEGDLGNYSKIQFVYARVEKKPERQVASNPVSEESGPFLQNASLGYGVSYLGRIQRSTDLTIDANGLLPNFLSLSAMHVFDKWEVTFAGTWQRVWVKNKLAILNGIQLPAATNLFGLWIWGHRGKSKWSYGTGFKQELDLSRGGSEEIASTAPWTLALALQYLKKLEWQGAGWGWQGAALMGARKGLDFDVFFQMPWIETSDWELTHKTSLGIGARHSGRADTVEFNYLAFMSLIFSWKEI